MLFHWKQVDIHANSLIYIKFLHFAQLQAHELIGQNKVKICKILSQNLKIFRSKIGCPTYNKDYLLCLL